MILYVGSAQQEKPTHLTLDSCPKLDMLVFLAY
jgi:hypothetical protein